MSSPLFIERRGSKGPSPPTTFGVSPPTLGIAYSPSSWHAGGILGSSPPARTSSIEKSSPYNQAKKWWKRISYDTSLDAEEFTVGIIESVEQAERKSGAEAWSMRVQEKVVEVPYVELLARYPSEDVPWHRIVYYRQRGAKVWEADFQRKRQAADSESGETPRSAGRLSSMSGAASASPLPPVTLAYLAKQATAGSPSDDEHSSSSNAAGTADEATQEEPAATSAAAAAAAAELRCFSDLPEECWVTIMGCLRVRDICMLARVCRYLRGLASAPALWQQQYLHLFGEGAPGSYNAATVRRMCRRSELRAARWLEAHVAEAAVGFAGTACLQIDDSKVVSGDGSSVRLWSHSTGRRIATLQGHSGRVTCVAFDDELIVSGCSQNVLKLWSMDDLKCLKTLRHHSGAVTSCLLLNGIPVSAGEDACICLWDAAAGAPILELQCERAVMALDALPQSGYLVSAGHTLDLWDVNTAQRLHTLATAAGADDANDELEALGGLEGVEVLGTGPPFSCVSYSGSLLAAGRTGEVELYDPRTQAVIGSIAAASRRAGGSPSGGYSPSRHACLGVQLDEWKLLAGFNDGSRSLALYDIRAALGGRGARAWTQPLQVYTAPARITSFQAATSTIIAGQEGSECVAWSFGAPGSCTAAAGGGAAVAQEAAEGGRGGKKKPAKNVKKQTRYPKRTTK